MQDKQNINWRKALKALALSVMVFAFSPSAHAQDITTGLVGHWKLDEISGTTAADSSGNGNDGTMGGGLDAGNDSIAGRIHTGLTLDGTENISIGDPAGGELDFNAAQDFSYSAWVNSSDIDTFALSKRNLNEGYEILVGRSGTIGNYSCRIDGGTGATYSANFNVGNDGQWHHIACVVDQVNNQLRIYGDGAQIGAATDITALGTIETTVGLRIGSRGAGNTQCDCDLDDVRVYNRALTAEDVAVLASGTAPGGLRYNDETESVEYHSGYSWVHAGHGPYSANGVTFDGTNDYLSGTALSDSKQVTGSFWFKANSTNDYRFLYADFAAFVFRFQNNRFRFIGENDAGTMIMSCDSSTSYGDTDWHHVMFSFDMSDSGKRHIYVDGSSDLAACGIYTDDTLNLDQPTDIGNETNYFDGSLADLWIDSGTYIDLSDADNRRRFRSDSGAPMYLGPDGSLPLDGAPDIFLSGPTDEWHTNKGTGGGFTENGALTDAATQPGQSDITSGLVGHWTLDETSGSTITDYGSGGNDGTWNDGVNNDVAEETVAGEIDTALNFDSVNEYINLGNPTELQITGGLTIAAWARPTSSHDGHIVAKWDWPNEDNASYRLQTDSASGGNIDYEFRVYNGTCGSTSDRRSGEVAVPINEWHHIVGVYEPSTAVRLYIDGQLAAERTTGIAASLANCANDVLIGLNTGPTLQRWRGDLDDVRIYNRVLSNEEVQALYNKSGICSNPTEPAGSILYNTDNLVMQYCNGTDWVAMGPVGGTGGGGCTSPAGNAGDLIFNEDYSVLQFCNSEDWVAIGTNLNQAPTNGLVGHWTLDELTGTTAADSSGYGNDGTWSGSVAVNSTSGKVATAFDFDGVDDDVHLGNYNAHLANSSTFTISFWASAQSYQNNETAISLGESGATSSTLIIRPFDNSNGNGPEVVWSSTIIDLNGRNDADGNMHHFLFISRSATDHELFINGQSVATNTSNLSLRSDIDDTIIGSWNNSQYFDGVIDDVRIYDRALSIGEIWNLYNAAR